MSILLPASHDVDLVVDLSNVCRDEPLGGAGASWERYVRVIDAWVEWQGRRPRGLAIADTSLIGMLSPADEAALRETEAAGTTRVVEGDADVDILDFARRSRACVLSKDRFLGHRGDHPWIQSSRDRFVAWNVSGGDVQLFFRDMGHASPFAVSKGQEADLFKARGIDLLRDRDRSLLDHFFRCENPSCTVARRFPNYLEEPPLLRHGDPECPGCGLSLTDLGARPSPVQFVIDLDGVELQRPTLEPGTDVVLGRATLEAAARRAAGRRLNRLSREHVRLAVAAEGDVLATDLGSANGTCLMRWDHDLGGWARPVVMAPHDARPLRRRDSLRLPDGVTVRRSGQEFPLAGPRAPRPSGGALGDTRLA